MTSSTDRSKPAAARWSALGDVYVAPPAAPTHRSFGLTVGGVLVAVSGLSAWRGHTVRAEAAGAVAALLIVAALLRPASLAGAARVWSRIGHALGWFNSRVLLTLIFALVLWPMGLMHRLFGADPLDRKRRDGSFWIDYAKRFRDPKHYERLF